MIARKSLLRCHKSSVLQIIALTDTNSLHNREHIAKFKCNKVHPDIPKTQNVLKNPEWISFDGNDLVYLPDFSLWGNNFIK